MKAPFHYHHWSHSSAVRSDHFLVECVRNTPQIRWIKPSYSQISDFTSTLFGNRTASKGTSEAVVLLPSTKSCRLFFFLFTGVPASSDICNVILRDNDGRSIQFMWTELEMMHRFLEKEVILAPLYRSMNEIFMMANITRCPNSHSITVRCMFSLIKIPLMCECRWSN